MEHAGWNRIWKWVHPRLERCLAAPVGGILDAIHLGVVQEPDLAPKKYKRTNS